MTGADPRSRPSTVILISGRGSNMQAIAEAALANRLPITVRAVLSDGSDAPGLATARRLGVATAVVNPRPGMARIEYDRELAAAIREYSPAIVVLAGFMRILSPPFVEEFLGRTLNIHPSLLPRYPGLHTHQRALAARESEHGASVHFVTQELDGGPVVIQGKVRIHPDDDAEQLAARVHTIEHRIYPEAIAWLATGRLLWNAGKVLFDSLPLTEPKILDAREL